MVLLQSFDDDFIYQGKHTTGGDRRKTKPLNSHTQVGNAVTPLMARVIAKEKLNLRSM
jgi:DNA (cytosine-5)-methyltransferase 1